MTDQVEKIPPMPIHPFASVLLPAQPAPPTGDVAAELSPDEASVRTPAEVAARERAEQAAQVVSDWSDVRIRIELAHFRVDYGTIPEWRDANREYERAVAEYSVARRIDNRNDQARMERKRQATIREGEKVKARWAAEEREAAALRQARARSLPGRIGRLMGRE